MIPSRFQDDCSDKPLRAADSELKRAPRRQRLPDGHGDAEDNMHFSMRRSNVRGSWLSQQAKKRVSERCSLPATAVRAMIDTGRYVWLGESSVTRSLNFIYSQADDRYLVVVQDISNRAVVTVLPLWMWKNGTLLETSSEANEARRLALEPPSPRSKREEIRHRPGRPSGLFGRRR